MLNRRSPNEKGACWALSHLDFGKDGFIYGAILPRKAFKKSAYKGLFQLNGTFRAQFLTAITSDTLVVIVSRRHPIIVASELQCFWLYRAHLAANPAGNTFLSDNHWLRYQHIP
jgi:hypothetical protein